MSEDSPQLARIEKKLDKMLLDSATVLERVDGVKNDMNRHERRLNDHSERLQKVEQQQVVHNKVSGLGERLGWALFSATLSLVTAIGAYKFKG